MSGFWQACSAIGLLALGAFFKYLFDLRVQAKRLPRRELSTEMFWCPMATSPMGPHGPSISLLVDGQQVQQGAVMCHRLKNTGNVAVENVRVRLIPGTGNNVIRWQYRVQQGLYCDRLKAEKQSQDDVRVEWAYLNVKDAIDLYMWLAPCSDPTALKIEVDAKDVAICETPLTLDCQFGKRLPAC